VSSIVAADEFIAQDLTAQDLLVEVERPLTEWIARHTDSTVLLWASDNLVEPTIRIVVILLLAWIGLRLVRKAIRRAVVRATEPEGLAARRLGAKIRLIDDSPRAFSTRRAQRADAMGALFTSISGFVVWTLALFMILGTFGINLGPLIAGAGLVGVAVGFGAQNLVRDFISGVSMLLEDQFGVGDVIDAGEAVGVVEGISLRTTRIRDVTGTLWHVPNGEITRIGNMSQEWARALLDIGVAYGTDIDAASEIILRVANAMAEEPDHAEEILEEPEVWGVQDLADDSVVIRLVVKTVPGRQWAVARALRRRIKMAFDAANVEIPFPQRTVWLRTEAPVALGDADTPAFENPLPADAEIDEAVGITRAVDEQVTSSPDQELPDPN
jgi:moderate conductance mechanosensitive channel